MSDRYMEECLRKVAVGRRIAIEAGVIRVCKNCEIPVCTWLDIEGAYELGNEEFSAGDLKDEFRDRQDMADAITKAVEECSDECWCRKD